MMEGEIFGSLSVCCFERDSERWVGVLPLGYLVSFINPLTPELNPSPLRYLARFFTGSLLLEP
jgi:hypothetical protein